MTALNLIEIRARALAWAADLHTGQLVALDVLDLIDALKHLTADHHLALGEISRMTMRPAEEVLEAERQRETALDRMQAERDALESAAHRSRCDLLDVQTERDALKIEVLRLAERQQELLQLVANISQSVPLCTGRLVHSEFTYCPVHDK